jgi:Zn-dependent M28 family amino/carboxypeptidase
MLVPDRYQEIWDKVKMSQARSKNNLPKDRTDIKDTLLTLSFTSESFSKFFKGQKYSFEELLKKKNENQKLPVFQLNGALDVDIIRNFEVKKSFNIVGVIEGNDPQLKKQYVALSAHYDHDGIINGEIYNGADDNGSGTVAVMEVARAFKKSKDNKRSILVIFHGAEEKGLLGSKYFTDTLKIIDDIVALINLDMVGRGSIDTIYSIGSDRVTDEMKEIVELANKHTSKFFLNYKLDTPNDPNNFFQRSDHYNYARYKIPIVFFFDYMTEDYHKESDEVDKINFRKIKKIADLVYDIVLRISNLDHRPGEKVIEEEGIFGN